MMPTAVGVAEKDGIRLQIVVDVASENPRNWDNLGTMVCWHRRYDLGDPHDFATPDDFMKFANENRVIMLPLYLLDHGGLWMGTHDFNDPWDSGQVGWIYVTREKVREEFKVKRITKSIYKKVLDILQAEVDTYNDYLQGNVYGYILERKCECDKCGRTDYEQIDSCFGFYGTNWKKNGMTYHLGDYAYLLDELKEV